MSAQAHTPSSAGPLALVNRVTAAGERLLPFAGPAVALVLGVVALGRAPVDVDESATIAAASGPFTDVVKRAFEDDPARVGYLALLRPVVAWNDGELWVRLPSVLATIVAAIAVYRLGRRLFDRRVGAIASLILASSLGVVMNARTVGPLALALAAMLVSTALFARAVERGHVVWWGLYAVTTMTLPLTHPIAASALAAQLVALALARREVDLRMAVPAAAIATLECSLFLGAAVVDRAAAGNGAGSLELDELGIGVGRALGWSPVVAALAGWGFVVLVRLLDREPARWRLALVAGLAGMPLVGALAVGTVLPVYVHDALTVSAGGLALAAGAGLIPIQDRTLRLATLGSVIAVAVAALVTAGLAERRQDWREAAAVARSQVTARDTVVVVPARARAALEYYAPELEPIGTGRGAAVTVVVVGDPALAVAAAREVVSPPRYALLEQQPAGTALVVQRWVRPGS